MTSAPTPAESASPTAFTTRLTTAALSASASRTTRRLSPPIPSPHGGNARDRVAMAVLPSSSFWRTQAAATIAVPGPGKRKFRLSWQSIWYHCHGRSLSYRRIQMEPHRTPAVLRDFQTLGRRTTRQLRKDAGLHSQYQHRDRLGCDGIPGSNRVTSDLLT